MRISTATLIGTLTATLTSTLTIACVPNVDTDESQLGAPRLLAVRAEPAEAAPGETVRFVGLYAGASGALSEAALDWAFCTARKPLAELGPVSTACLEEANDFLSPIGTGLEVSGAIPRDACRLFGPEPPPAERGEPAGRPVDPDVTGGYSQPLRVLAPEDAGDALSIIETRLACGLAGATQAQSVEFARRYRRNVAPRIEALELVRDDGVLVLGGEVATVRPGETVRLRVRWPECPAADACGDGLCGIDETAQDCAADCTELRSCEGAERFLRFDSQSRALVTERESIRAAWYVSRGSLESERTGVGEDDARAETQNELTLPDAPGDITVIVVLRDSRGGVSWAVAALAVEP